MTDKGKWQTMGMTYNGKWYIDEWHSMGNGEWQCWMTYNNEWHTMGNNNK